MTNSTFPNEWLQPLVTEKLQELNREATKDFVTVEKKVFDTLQKNNLNLTERLDEANAELNKARLALAKVYEIVDHEYNWEYDYGIGEIYGADLKELAHIIKEYGV